VYGGGLGGLDEVRIPGLRVREALRLPLRLAQQTRGADLAHNPISVVLQRITADFPYHAGSDVEAAQTDNPFDAVDPETGIQRQVALPAARSYRLSGWASVRPDAPDPSIDRLAGVPTGWRMASSSRFEGTPINRASSAFDGNPRTAWIGNLLRGRTSWLAVHAPHPFAVRRFRLRPRSPPYGFPSRVDVVSDAGLVGEAAVAPDGTVTLPRSTRTRSLRLNLVDVRPPKGARLLRAVAISDVEVPGLQPPRPRRHGPFATGCGDLAVRSGGSTATAAVAGDLPQLDAGGALPLRGCGGSRSLRLPAGASLLSAGPGPVMRPDFLRLTSAPPAGPLPAAVDPRPTAAVVSPGKGHDGSRDNVRLRVRSPSWLVLGESYSRGWRAWCGASGGTERSLGSPVVIDGYANGWRVGSGCREARFEFAPQQIADWSYWCSALGGLALLLVILAEVAWRRRAVSVAARVSAWVTPPADPVRRLALRGSLTLALVAGVLGGIVFAWRAGAGIGLVAFAVARLGVNARRLLALAVLGLVAMTIAYVADPAPDAGGFFFPYAFHYITAHWIGVGVVCALIGATVLMAWEVRAPNPAGEPRGGQLGRRARSLIDGGPRLGRRRQKTASG
jgi:hypothetical protein